MKQKCFILKNKVRDHAMKKPLTKVSRILKFKCSYTSGTDYSNTRMTL